MKNKKTLHLITLLCLILGFSSCKDSGKKLMKNATGKPGSLIVVVPDNLWESQAGKEIRSFLAQPVPSLPQDEPMLDVINIPIEGFTDIFKTTRNILMVQVNSQIKKEQVIYSKDLWSSPQTVVRIKASSQEALIALFHKHEKKILSYYLSAENKILMDTYKKNTFRDKAAGNHLLEKFNINMNFPKGFSIALDKPNFSWIRFEARETSQGVFVWSMPYENEDQFQVENLIAVRDSMLKTYIEGPAPNSYMATVKDIKTLNRTFKLNNNYAVELRGLWKVEGDFMGGPWVSISVLDVIKKRIITVDGYIYSPKYDKRNLLRQVEATLRSVSFPYQKDIDKANKKIESIPMDITVKPSNGK